MKRQKKDEVFSFDNDIYWFNASGKRIWIHKDTLNQIGGFLEKLVLQDIKYGNEPKDNGSPPALMVNINGKHLNALFDCVRYSLDGPCNIDLDINPFNIILLSQKLGCDNIYKRLLASYPHYQKEEGKIMYEFMKTDEVYLLNEDVFTCFYCKNVIRKHEIETECTYHSDIIYVTEHAPYDYFKCCGSRLKEYCKKNSRHYHEEIKL